MSDSTPEYTAARKKAMIEALALFGTITHAAEVAGIDRGTHYDWVEKDPDYAAEYKAAMERYADSVRMEVHRRAMEGVDEPLAYQGNLTGAVVRKYSDRLLERLAEAKCPEFKQKHEISGTTSTVHYDADKLAHLTDEQLRDLEALTRLFAVTSGDTE